MGDARQYCLKWNNHPRNVATVFDRCCIVIIIIVIVIVIIVIVIVIVMIIVTRPRPAFGRLGLGGSSRGYSFGG